MSGKWFISGLLNLVSANNLYKFKLQADNPDINPDGTEKAEEAIEAATDYDRNVSTNNVEQEAGG